MCKECEVFKNNFNFSSENAVYSFPLFPVESLIPSDSSRTAGGAPQSVGSGAAGFGWGDLGPRHSHSLGFIISNYAVGRKKSSRLKILGPLSTSNSKYAPKQEEGYQ